MDFQRLRPSPSMGVALLALAIALSGTAYAANKIGTNQIKANAVTTAKIRNNAVTPAKTSAFKTLLNGTRLVATDGATLDAARAAAPAKTVFRKGAITVYAKCFRDTVTDELQGSLYARTTKNFSIMEGNDDLAGGPVNLDYLNTDTPEVDRELDIGTVTGPGTSIGEDENMVIAPGGPAISFVTGIAVKNGPAFANGPYGPGNACIFQGAAFG
jgi:hypothetical protein